MTTLKAYEVEYRVKLIAYGRTAEEAKENGEALFQLGDGDMQVKEFDEAYDEPLAFLRTMRALSAAKRSPQDDITTDD